MTITFNSWWLHGLMTLITLVWVGWAIEPRGDYDFTGIMRAVPPVLLYMGYWILYLALLR